MRIAGFIPESYQDHPHGLSSVIFTSGCNFSCPACHARNWVFAQEEYSDEEVEKLLRRIERNKKFINKIVLCGGEPTLQSDLEDFCRYIKKKLGKDFSIKLDTNGYNPEVIARLLQEELVNYVAMDVKAPPGLYNAVTGREVDLARIEESMRVATRFPYYEFRTTIAPVLRNGNISYMTTEETGEIAKWISSCTGKLESRYFLQPFVARSKEEMMDERFSKENLERLGIRSEAKKELLEKMLSQAAVYLVNTRVR